MVRRDVHGVRDVLRDEGHLGVRRKGSQGRTGGHGNLAVAGMEDLHARWEGVVVRRDEVVDHPGDPRDLASRTPEVDRAVRETQGCRRWRMDDWGWCRQGWRRSPRMGFVG